MGPEADGGNGFVGGFVGGTWPEAELPGTLHAWGSNLSAGPEADGALVHGGALTGNVVVVVDVVVAVGTKPGDEGRGEGGLGQRRVSAVTANVADETVGPEAAKVADGMG